MAIHHLWPEEEQRTDAFGNPANPPGSQGTLAQPFGYTGEPTDPLGLVDLRARVYSPVLGRFLQRDAYAGSVLDPQSLNRSAYAGNNPTTLTDPSGRSPLSRVLKNASDLFQGVTSQARPMAVLALAPRLGLAGEGGEALGGAACVATGACEIAAGVFLVVGTAAAVGYTGYEIYQNRQAIGDALSNVAQFAGKAFRGGRQGQRDRNYGITDKAFWDWWHRVGKQQAGGQDITSREEAEQEYQEWQDLGRPRAPKGS